MKFGIIGLGKMGHNLALNARDHHHHVIAYNRSQEKIDQISKQGVDTAYSLQELCERLGKQKVIMLMLTAGKPIDLTIQSLVPYLKTGDIIIDAGNSFYEDSIRRSKMLARKGILFLDSGTSGGVDGARNGANFMIGGSLKAFKKTEQLFKDLSVKGGYAYFGKAGSGHFVKMVHNGIEYGMMQAIGEGMDVIDSSNFNINKEKLCSVWANGSVIRSWLIELLKEAYSKSQTLKGYTGSVGMSGEGEWTVKTAKRLKVNIPIIKGSVNARKLSIRQPSYQGKVVQALRYGFGRHKQVKR
ncbi:MAG: decarboxylating 6-phosphogluconate dehydrogenase [Nanoarchaeota archaeon]|nr:decarboxylating 6-phosphogluconate dehydrogenase [Nanoarchaeota archaeon]MBU1704686.1 decarboxylating 6-phosphogluconate dehydrogenase [Nanoarchaeota archaeon]